MFNFAREEPARPNGSGVFNAPTDELPVAVVLITQENRGGIGQFLKGGLSSTKIDDFIQMQAKDLFEQKGPPYAACDREGMEDPVAQFWQHNTLSDPAFAVVVRRVGVARFLVEAVEGANFLVLYKGDPAQGKGAAALLCFTASGQKTQFVPVGDPTVFAPASFKDLDVRRGEFFHVLAHILKTCTSCTASFPKAYNG